MLCARENLLFYLSISDVHDSTTNCRHTLCQNITNIKMRTNLPTAKGTACSSVVSHILQEQEATVKLQLHRSTRAKSPILSSAWNHHSCVSVPSLLCEAPQTWQASNMAARGRWSHPKQWCPSLLQSPPAHSAKLTHLHVPFLLWACWRKVPVFLREGKMETEISFVFLPALLPQALHPSHTQNPTDVGFV